jgi:hypothetical protein
VLHCSVREAQERIDSREFAEWIAEYSLEPWGEVRTDLMIAQLCAIMVNAWRGKQTKAVKAIDFMPRFDPRESNKLTTAAQIAVFFQSMVQAKRGGDKPSPPASESSQ